MNYKDIYQKIESSVFKAPILQTPTQELFGLSQKLNNTLYIKREDMQDVFSFKIRGAFHKMSLLSDTEKKRGVIAASAGNHAQGVALGARHLEIKARIVMPKTTPSIKIEAVKALGATVILEGDNYDAAYLHTQELVQKTGETLIHPFDDKDVIVGQGGIAKELVSQLKEPLDVIYVAVGGGGLLAGVASYIKAIWPNTKIIGVEAQDSACLSEALKAGERVILDQVGIFADGVAVKQIGKNTFEVIKGLVDEVVLVSIDEICGAIKDIYDEKRVIAEPAGALSLAGLKKHVKQHKIQNQSLGCILCGANVNFNRLGFISDRAELGRQKEAILGITIPEKKGSFLQLCHLLENRFVTEFHYRYQDSNEASIFLSTRLEQGESEKKVLIESIKLSEFSVSDYSDNDLAKNHIRYMVGGQKNLEDELLFRFQFPERPGGLGDFLETLGSKFNISVFHYRYFGTSYGRVLVGFEVSRDKRSNFYQSLDQLGYPYLEESDNDAYHLFLKDKNQ